jgi:hypothetical protein
MLNSTPLSDQRHLILLLNCVSTIVKKIMDMGSGLGFMFQQMYPCETGMIINNG